MNEPTMDTLARLQDKGKGSSLLLNNTPRPTSGTTDGAPGAFWGLSRRNDVECDDGHLSILV